MQSECIFCFYSKSKGKGKGKPKVRAKAPGCLQSYDCCNVVLSSSYLCKDLWSQNLSRILGTAPLHHFHPQLSPTSRRIRMEHNINEGGSQWKSQTNSCDLRVQMTILICDQGINQLVILTNLLMLLSPNWTNPYYTPTYYFLSVSY